MSLYKNMNARKAKGISRPKNKSTITPEAYKNMEEGFPKKKRKKASTGGNQKEQCTIQVAVLKNIKI